MTRTSRLTALVGALALSTLLAACGGPATPGDGDSPAPDPTPSGTSTEDADGGDTGSTSAIGTTCDDLVPAGSLAPLFSTTLEPVGIERTPAYIATQIDDSWVARAAGGLACEWQDATSFVSTEGTSEYHGVRLTLAPAPHAGFAESMAYSLDPDDDVLDCNGGICRRDTYINGWWLSLLGYLFENEAYESQAILQFDAIIARVQALPAPRPVPHTSTLSDDCTELLPASAVGAAFGVPASSVSVEWEVYLGLRATVLSQLGGVLCDVAIDGHYIGIVETLPSGAWAMEDSVAAYLEIGGEEQRLAIPGLTEPGSFRAQVEANGFDFVSEGDWIKVIVWPTDGPMTAEQISVAVAGAIVAAR